MISDSEVTAVILNNYCYPQGGASRVVIDEAVELSSLGVKVKFIGAVGPVCRELQSSDIEVSCLNQTDLADGSHAPAVMLQGLWNTQAYKVVDSILAELDPRLTIIHLHGFTQALSSSPVRCALKRGFEVVYTMHDFFTACPNGGFYDYVERSICQRRALSLRCIAANCDKRRYAHKLYRVARSMVQLHLGRIPSGIKNYIGLSQRSTEVILPYLPPDVRIFSLPNAIAIEKGPPVSVAKNRRVVAVGRLDPEKGVRVLLEAAANSDMELVLIGDGPLRTEAESRKNTRVTGWLPRDSVVKEMEQARCLVFPSLWYETFGLAVDEAAAKGIPAIVTESSAAAERVIHGKTGWCVKAGDVDELARHLRQIEDDALVERAGEAAYDDFWSRRATPQSHAAELRHIYREILDARKCSCV